MEKEINIKRRVLIIGAILIIMYLIGSFTAMNFDPHYWRFDVRVFVGSFSGMFIAIGLLVQKD